MSVEEIIMVGVWLNVGIQSTWFIYDIYLERRKK